MPVRLSVVLLFLTISFLNSAIAQHQVIFEDDFETGELGPEWTAGSSVEQGIVGVHNTIQGLAAFRDGEYGVALGQNVDGVSVTNTLDLNIDLAGYNQVTIAFDLYDRGDETDTSDGIYFSQDGTAFKKVLDFAGSGWVNGWGKLPPIDVDLLAAAYQLELTSTFVIRIQQTGNAKFGNDSCCDDVDGIFLDNVQVIAEETVFAGLPFFDDFESGILGQSWRWVDPALAGQTAPEGTIRLKGTARVATALQGIPLAYEGQFGMVLGRYADGSNTANAADLHLDLAGHSDVKLQFRMFERNDETHVYDGLYFSNDGGETFKKVFDFRGGSWADQWGVLPPLDVDALAASVGLAFSSSFVIRFQQYDDAAFARDGCCDDFDGLILDDVSVYSRPVEYVTIPFEDGFEDAGLNTAWQWSDATFPVSTSFANTTIPSSFVSKEATVSGVNVPRTGSFGIAIGRLSDNIAATNVLDLHLNLLGENEVDLSFYLNDLNNEQHLQDAIYFSDNGGQTFTRVYQFATGSLADNVYRQHVLDVDALATAFELSLTDRFIIRFQEYDDDAITRDGCCDDYDAFLLDDVSVTVGEPGITVWPGDANDDGRVDQADVLPVGLYWANQGPARAGFGINWMAQSVTPWSVPVATFADTDGSGEVNESDILPIGLFWGNERGDASKGATSFPEQAAGAQSTVQLIPGVSTDRTVEFVLAITEAVELMGVAFKINYPIDKLLMEAVVPGRFLGDQLVSFVDVDPDAGAIAAAFSRTGSGIQGEGEVARIVFEKLPAWDAAELSITRIAGSYAWGGIEPIEVSSPVLSVSNEARSLPGKTTLHGNYPNPFQSQTDIAYQVGKSEGVTIEIFNIMGKRVRTLVDGVHPPGVYTQVWDGTNDQGEDVAAGIYLLQMKADSQRFSRPITRIR